MMLFKAAVCPEEVTMGWLMQECHHAPELKTLELQGLSACYMGDVHVQYITQGLCPVTYCLQFYGIGELTVDPTHMWHP